MGVGGWMVERDGRERRLPQEKQGKRSIKRKDKREELKRGKRKMKNKEDEDK